MVWKRRPSRCKQNILLVKMSNVGCQRSLLLVSILILTVSPTLVMPVMGVRTAMPASVPTTSTTARPQPTRTQPSTHPPPTTTPTSTVHLTTTAHPAQPPHAPPAATPTPTTTKQHTPTQTATPTPTATKQHTPTQTATRTPPPPSPTRHATTNTPSPRAVAGLARAFATHAPAPAAAKHAQGAAGVYMSPAQKLAAEAVAAKTSQGFVPVAPRLATRWSADVYPGRIPHQEYPRPQMQRDSYINLNGIWQFEFDDSPALIQDNGVLPITPQFGKTLTQRIMVPFPIESSLSGIGVTNIRAAPHTGNAWYRRALVIPPEFNGKRVLLNFGAVDFETHVWVNGKHVVQGHKGGYDKFSADITDALRSNTGDQAHEVIVHIRDWTNEERNPVGKQRQSPWLHGIVYTACSGIWQTVWMEAVPLKAYIKRLDMIPDTDRGVLKLTVHGEASDAASNNVKAVAFDQDGKNQVGTGAGSLNNTIEIPIPNAKLWWPGNSYLYKIKVSLGADGEDTVNSYFAMRKVNLLHQNGFTRIAINNKFMPLVGLLDQGYWPDGIYTPPTEDAMVQDLLEMRKVGLNMIRKHIKVESDRWYYQADRLGFAVIQDVPSIAAESLQPWGYQPTDIVGKYASYPISDHDLKQLSVEVQRMQEELLNNPSIIATMGYNEGWGQYQGAWDPVTKSASTIALAKQMQSFDPSRLVDAVSGWMDVPTVGDIMDIHDYHLPTAEWPDATGRRAGIIGECGGVCQVQVGHTWEHPPSMQGVYGPCDTSGAGVLEKFAALQKGFLDQMRNYGLSAVVWTQLTDVEGELNGLLMTYDRTPKLTDAESARLRSMIQNLTTLTVT